MFKPAINPAIVWLSRKFWSFLAGILFTPVFTRGRLKLGLVVLLMFSISTVAHATALWAPILNSTNGYDWQGQGGVQGGIPSGSWTQCGSTIAAYTGTSTTINNAIAACSGLNQFVLLGAGTFNLSTSITWSHDSGVVLRGGGANTTFLVFGSGATAGCGGNSALFCINSSSSVFPGPGGFSLITINSGYTQGSTSLVLASVAGITAGISQVIVNQCNTGLTGNGTTTPGCGTGSEVDNGGYFNSGAACVPSGTNCSSGSSQSGPDTGNGVANRFQAEVHTVTNVNSGTNTLTLGEPITHANFASGSSPQVYVVNPVVTNDGVENLSIDGSASSGFYGIQFFSATNVWVSGVRVINPAGAPISIEQGSHFTFQNNYLWEEQGSDDFAISNTVTSYGLIQNNIMQQHVGGVIFEGSDTGTVVGYNYMIGNCNYLSNPCSDALANAYRPHSNGTDFELYEGNVGTNYYADGSHGTHLSVTLYRNLLTGWESCGVSNSNLGVVNTSGTAVTWVSGATFTTGTSWNGRGIAIAGVTPPLFIASVTDSTHLTLTTSAGAHSGVAYGVGPCGTTNQKDFDTNAVLLSAYQGRYHFFFDNVLGTPGYHNAYLFTTGFGNQTVINAGAGYGGGSSPLDPLSNFGASLTDTAYGDYDVATAATRWCGTSSNTGWTLVCGSVSEVSTAAPTFPNAVPTVGDISSGQGAFPASLYLASRPSWWPSSIAFPAIGGELTGGNVGQCSGTLNSTGHFNGSAALTNPQCGGNGFTSSAWAGHVNAIPAMACYLNTMGGTPDGSGTSPLSFDASVCYASSPSNQNNSYPGAGVLARN